MYKCTYYKLIELVHPKIIGDIGEHLSWQRLDGNCLKDLDLIRETWGSEIYINSGKNDSRGLRPPNDVDGAFYSIHKQGKAFDLSPKMGTVKDLWEMVYQMVQEGSLYSINTLEALNYTPTWVHIANTNTSEEPLIISP